MYSTTEVAKLLGLSPAQVRGYVRSGFLQTIPADKKRLIFSFQDLVLLRTAKGLMDAQIASRRVRTVLKKLKDQLPTGRPLTGVAISAEGNRVVVRDGQTRWNPENGQGLFDFDVSALARKVAPILAKSARQARLQKEERSAEEWYQLGCDLEVAQPTDARDAYRRSIELNPSHADAHVNLGRLLHEHGELDAAEAHYRVALTARADDSTAAFNLGVVLEDAGKIDEAIASYESCLRIDARSADAHFNVARLYERSGRTMLALRHLKEYRELTT